MNPARQPLFPSPPLHSVTTHLLKNVLQPIKRPPIQLALGTNLAMLSCAQLIGEIVPCRLVPKPLLHRRRLAGETSIIGTEPNPHGRLDKLDILLREIDGRTALQPFVRRGRVEAP